MLTACHRCPCRSRWLIASARRVKRNVSAASVGSKQRETRHCAAKVRPASSPVNEPVQRAADVMHEHYYMEFTQFELNCIIDIDISQSLLLFSVSDRKTTNTNILLIKLF